MSSLPCDVVLLPSDDLSEHAIATSVRLNERNTAILLSPTGPVPHISLYMTQLKGEDLDFVSELPRPSTFSGPFTRLGLFEMGDNGTCIREIRTFKLGITNKN